MIETTDKVNAVEEFIKMDIITNLQESELAIGNYRFCFKKLTTDNIEYLGLFEEEE